MAKSTKNEKSNLSTGSKVAKGKVAKLTKPAAAEKVVKAPKEKGEGRKGRVGSDLAYTVVGKDNPFREGTIRHDLWAHIKASKSTAAARALDSRISSAFMQDLADKEIIKFA